ncbi:UNVERIFIED_CONTAM: hypothetical protein Sradi_6953900 [Sesamum radiatum]|uniref:G-patch domain-containing protein n=1 Tax=Sesamum radiatum TaxID=300843 RepID=A0AAW2JFN7_SESRA
MAVNVAPFKLKGIVKDNVAPKNNVPYEKPQRKLTLKEMQARQYPFLDSDVSGIFDDLLEANLIDLPEMKRPEEAERKDDPKYCKYHRLVGHAIQDCFVFKDKVMQLARQGKISLEEDSAETNVVTIKNRHFNGNKDACNTTYRDDTEDTLLEKEDSSDTDDCMSTITFTDEDLLLGSKPHNRPLFVAGYVREQKVNRILIDGGSAVNILPLRILKELEIPIDELSNSHLMIQGFNQGGQRAVGIIRMQLTMEDMVSTALFHVIDVKTSYNMLLDRPWLHENVVVPSTWHQCFKYYRNGVVKKVLDDSKPFTEAESHFVDAKYYIEGDKKMNLKQPSKPPLKGFVPSTQEDRGGHEALAFDEEGFDPKGFKLLVKVGYNPKEKLSLGKLPPEATATQIMLKEKGYAIQDSGVGLGFTPPKPVRIAIRRVSSNYAVEGLDPRQRMGYQKKGMFKVTTPSKKKIKSSHTRRLRSLIPSRMKRQKTLAISCGEVVKVKAQTMIFTQVQSDNKDDRESVASSNYISNGVEEDICSNLPRHLN